MVFGAAGAGGAHYPPSIVRGVFRLDIAHGHVGILGIEPQDRVGHPRLRFLEDLGQRRVVGIAEQAARASATE